MSDKSTTYFLSRPLFFTLLHSPSRWVQNCVWNWWRCQCFHHKHGQWALNELNVEKSKCIEICSHCSHFIINFESIVNFFQIRKYDWDWTKKKQRCDAFACWKQIKFRLEHEKYLLFYEQQVNKQRIYLNFCKTHMNEFIINTINRIFAVLFSVRN